MSYIRKAARGVGLVFFMTLLAGLISYATRIVIARHLGPEEYGLFSSVFTFVVFFLFFRDLGLGTALVKFIASFKAAGKFNEIKTAIFSVFVMQFGSSVLLSIIFVALSGWLARDYFKDSDAGIVLLIMTVYVFCSVLFTLTKQVLNGFQENVLYSVLEPLKNFIVLLLTLLFFSLGFGVFSPALSFAFVCPIIFLLFFPAVKKRFPFSKYKMVSFRKISHELFLFGLPMIATDVGGKIIGYIDTLMLTSMRSLAEVGIYNVILPTAVFFVLISRAVSSVIFPMVSELSFKNDISKMRKGVELLHKYTFIAAIPLVFTLFSFSSFFLTLFFGEEYASGSLAFQILLVGVFFYVMAGINNNLIAGMGKPQEVTKIIFFAALLNVAANMILIPYFGINGAAFSTAASYCLILLFSTIKLTADLKIKFPLFSWLKLILPAVAFILTIFTVQSLLSLNQWAEIVLSLGGALLMYGIMLFLFELINIKEIKYYTKIIAKR